MKKLTLILLFLSSLLLSSYDIMAACTGSGTSWNSTPDESSINTCVTNCNANPGSTLTISAGDGSETWTTTKGFIRGVTVVGPGSASLTITSIKDPILKYDPDSTAQIGNEAFEISGLTLNANNAALYLGNVYVEGGSGIFMTNVKVHDIIFLNNASKCFVSENNIVGVLYNNTFTNCQYTWGIYGSDYYTWNRLSPSYSSSNAWYIEDNTVNFTGGSTREGRTTTGQGTPGIVIRYNTYDYSGHGTGTPPPHDNHGLQSMSTESGSCVGSCGAGMTCYPDLNCSDQYSTLSMELYGNIGNDHNGTYQWASHRGSWMMMFNNILSGSGDIEINEYSCDSAQASIDGQIPPQDFVQHVNNTYAFNNWGVGTTREDMFVSSDLCRDNAARASFPYTITENRDFYNYNPSFNGTTGIGCGASIPTGSCTSGVGYWVTSYSPCSSPPLTIANAKTYTQAGDFYKCVNSSWVKYYEPYTYPHPLRTAAPIEGCNGTSPNLTAISASQADVMACIAGSTYGDTITVPAGTATWTAAAQGCTGDSMLCIKKGITLQGGSGGTTTINLSGTASYGAIQYVADATSISTDEDFRVTGFTIDAGGTYYGEGMIMARNSSSSTPITRVRIDHNVLRNGSSGRGRGINMNGLIHGVIDHNTFTNVFAMFGAYSYDEVGWNNTTRQYGAATNLFVENNTCNITTLGFEGCTTDHGQGAPGVVYRYNSTDLANGALSGLWIIHGLQIMAVSSGFTCPSGCGYSTCTPSSVGSCNPVPDACGQWSTIKSEYYGNSIINSPNYAKWMAHRGSWLMMFYNSNDSAYASMYNMFDQYSCDICQSPGGENGGVDYSQHVQNTYIWKNLKSGGAELSMSKGLDYCGDKAIGTPYTITENVDYWNFKSAFNGSVGMGCGTAAARNAITPTVANVGYWVPNAAIDPTAASCSDISTYVGADNAIAASVGGNTGTFYKSVSDGGGGYTWQAYYTPYTYPHPLAGGIPAVDPEICNNSIDDDGDGYIDCLDSDCVSDPACAPDPEICNNGIDDDGDGDIDCLDADCVSDPACIEPAGPALSRGTGVSSIGGSF